MKQWIALGTLIACVVPSWAHAEWVDGEVVAVDVARKRLTIRHEPIAIVNMAAMTMPFRVSDASLLSRVKPGDRLRFDVHLQDDELVVAQIARRPSP